MKIFIVLAFAFAIALGLIFVPPVMLSDSYGQSLPPESTQRTQIIPGEYIVMLKPEAVGEPVAGDQDLSNSSLKKQQQNILIEADQAEELVEDQDANVTQIYDRVFNGFAIEGVSDVTPLVQDPAIDVIEPNVRVFPQAQYLPTTLDRMDLDKAVTASSRPDNREDKPNIDVAVVDQPVNSHHPDLYVVQRQNMIDGGCGTGKAPDGTVLQCYNEDGYHGTHVAGSIAARDNLGGVVGGMPGARIYSFSICSVNAGCANDDTLRAWNAIISNGQIEVGNMSVGSCGATVGSATQTAGTNLVNSGVTFFVSAGNCNANADNGNYCGVDAFICVSAMGDFDGKCGGKSSLTSVGSAGPTRDDTRAAFSNHGSDVDIMAPGVAVLSTLPGERTEGDQDPTGGWGTGSGKTNYIGTSPQGEYGLLSGTSMASPTAAGIGALIKFKNPSFTPAQVKSNMQANAYSQTLACDGSSKGGLVQGGNSESSEKILYAGNY